MNSPHPDLADYRQWDSSLVDDIMIDVVSTDLDPAVIANRTGTSEEFVREVSRFHDIDPYTREDLSSMSTQSDARRDAREFARAQMYYGEGAGNRRKLITATVESNSEKRPGYQESFEAELQRQDMGEHAEKARKERERTDRKEKLSKNTKAVLTGNYQGAQTAVMVVVLAGTVAHQTGFDKVVVEKTKRAYRDLKLRIRNRRAAKQRASGVYRITNVS